MKHLRYYLLDVFTDRPFGGNPLAVFPDADDLSKDLMQRIANELNLSETTFIQSPKREDSDCTVRIFTPENELPMAGHPTLGTAQAILSENLLSRRNEDALIFDEGVGQIRVDLTAPGEDSPRLSMHQPLPQFLDTIGTEIAASMLSLEPEEIDSNLPVQIVSCGIPMIIVPVKTLTGIGRIKPRYDLIEAHLEGCPSQEFFVFTRETTRPDTDVHCRFFAPRFGVPEDAATGSAHGPLGSYLFTHDKRHPKQFVSEQGVEMGRPSKIFVEIRDRQGVISDVIVGGHCLPMGRGELMIPDEL